ncbi:MAG: glycolate oxidase subunit GlcE [Gemmatimonadetes bacterium]|nr:glycolate oxidase subunit GlcE [Gemmatimonadota bacterium]
MAPATTDEVVEGVRQAGASGTSLALRAGGTKDRLGRATPAATCMDLSALTGIVTYEPDELILIARPATPLAQVQALLAEGSQHLAFEPPFWGPGATLGGTIGVAASGPRRFVAGAARDFVLGMELVDGRGRVIRAGGRVVKNVTGYDLWRSMVGAYGTLGVMTEICLKLWPRPETQSTLAVGGLSRQQALTQMFAWSRRPEAISGLSYTAGDRTLWVRVEGSTAAVPPQIESLRCDAEEGDILDEAASLVHWERQREGGGLQSAEGEILYRIVLPPSRADVAVTALEGLAECRWCLDWAGGLLWVVLPQTSPASAVHEIAVDNRGVAARVGSSAQDPNEDAFTPLSEPVARLNRTLQQALDPQGVFRSGRL